MSDVGRVEVVDSKAALTALIVFCLAPLFAYLNPCHPDFVELMLSKGLEAG